MNIRYAEEKDLAEIKNIYEFYYIKPVDAEYFTGRVLEYLGKTPEAERAHLQYLVAESEEGVTGLIGFRDPSEFFLKFAHSQNPVELYSLFARHKIGGVGKALVERMIQMTKMQGYTEVVVFSHSEWKESWPFYDKLGFERVNDPKKTRNGQIWIKEIK